MSHTDAHTPFKHSEYIGEDGYTNTDGPIPVLQDFTKSDREQMHRQNRDRRHKDRDQLHKILNGEIDADDAVFEASQLRDVYALPSF